jgi:hypothetical protein
MRENVKIHSIKTDIWLNYYKNLWSSKVYELTKTYSNNEFEDSYHSENLSMSLNTQNITKHLVRTVYRWNFINLLERPSNIDSSIS